MARMQNCHSQRSQTVVDQNENPEARFVFLFYYVLQTLTSGFADFGDPTLGDLCDV
jgi:hypothetical protein